VSRTVLIDPPWDYGDLGWHGHKGQRGYDVTPQYPVMRISEIARLPIPDLLGDDGHLWMWTTNPMLPLALPLFRQWGVRFIAPVTWVKAKRLPPGWDIRHTTEQLLFGKIGKTRTADRSLPTHIIEAPTRHSAKPEAAYHLIERANPEGWEKVEIFARARREGWLSYGNEIDGKDVFEAVAPFAQAAD
jgi:N6-adenosine-specific RNA methylase IME4